VDGSRHALRAVETAAELARRFEADLTLFTVTKELKLTPEVKRYLHLEQLAGEPQYVIDEHTEQIMAKARDVTDAAGVPRVRVEVRAGNPARTIIEYAQAHRFDCIVMGSRGLGDADGMLLGSVSHKVASLANCTVVTVKG
jgi:nucleotide-binding universal stress UspA family protein